jgi:hypothetical protein
LKLERRCAFIHRGRGLKEKAPEEQDAQNDGDGDDDDLDETHDLRSFDRRSSTAPKRENRHSIGACGLVSTMRQACRLRSADFGLRIKKKCLSIRNPKSAFRNSAARRAFGLKPRTRGGPVEFQERLLFRT